MQFPEDDEMTPEEARDELRQHNEMMGNMADREQLLRKKARQPQLDPKDVKLVELAKDAGYTLGVNEALTKRITFLEQHIEARDKQLEQWKGHDIWRDRALAAEGTIARSKKLKSRR